MQKFISSFRKGFTLIELLIVIVIIGVLATAVLSAINPIEQIRKARDAGRRSDAAELLNALERYYTAYENYPWEIVSGSTVPGQPGTSGQSVSGSEPWLAPSPESLVGTDELKDEFTARDTLSDLLIWHATPSDLVRICFNAESQQNQEIASYNALGTTDTSGTFLCVPE